MIPPNDLQHQHQEALELIPWYLNGTLSEGERERVQQHLVACAACRDELREQELIRGHITASDTRPERAPAAFAALAERIDAEAPRARTGGWRAIARVAAAVVAALAVWQLAAVGNRAEEPSAVPVNEFRVLADPEACVGDLSVQFRATAGDAAIHQLLESGGLEIACAPSAGLYKLRLTDPARDAETVAADLRQHEIVDLALAAAARR